MTLSSLLILLRVLAAGLEPGIEALPCPNSKSAWSYLYNDVDGGADLFGIASCPDGGVVLAGRFGGALDFDRTEGVDLRMGHGGYDAFVTKVNADGSYGWTYTAGAPHVNTVATGVGVAPDGSVIATGTFQGTVDFDPTDGVDEHTSLSYDDGPATFVTRLSGDGTYLDTIIQTGSGSVGPNDMALDRDGNVLFVGHFDSGIDFDPGPGVVSDTGYSDIFVTKLGPDGSHRWTHTVGSDAYDNGEDIAVDSDGNVYATGTFRHTVDFDPTSGFDPHTMVGPYEDTFVSKYYPDGSYAWTRTYDTDARDIAATLDGGVLVTGWFENSFDFDPGEGVDLRTSAGRADIFVTKLAPNGSYAWTYTVGGPASEAGLGLEVDGLGNIFVAGTFAETVDFDPGPGIDEYTGHPYLSGFRTSFLSTLRGDGSYVLTRVLGEGDAYAAPKSLAAGSRGEVFVGGSFIAGDPGGDLDPGCEVELHASHFPASRDAFVAKLVCPELSADFDGNGVVDLHDAAQFQLCFTDEGPATCGDGCPRLDLDPDDDIDLDDYTAFRKRLTGPQPRELVTPSSPITTHRETAGGPPR